MISEHWKTQSAVAAQKGTCHTEGECREMYAELTRAEKHGPIAYLQDVIAPYRDKLSAAIAADPEHWIAEYHFGWGMGIRNGLRTAGFGEDYFNVDNLDCIYVQLIEEALRCPTEDRSVRGRLWWLFRGIV